MLSNRVCNKIKVQATKDIMAMVIMITVLCSLLISNSVAAPFQPRTGLDLRTFWYHKPIISSKVAAHNEDVLPDNTKERDKTLCGLLKHAFHFVFHLNIPFDNYCGAIREREKPDESHQKRLYDFILKHLKTLDVW